MSINAHALKFDLYIFLKLSISTECRCFKCNETRLQAKSDEVKTSKSNVSRNIF